MTPQEKAKELVNKFEAPYPYQGLSKDYALMAVDEMIQNGNLKPQVKRHIGNVEPSMIHLEYWFQVKSEIENL